MSAPKAAAPRLTTDSDERKAIPLASGCLDYFPDALAAVAELSHKGNEKHNPGQPLHWARGKSTDEADCLVRHFLERGTVDTDGIRHSAKVAWRALALLQKEIEAAQGLPPSRGSWVDDAAPAVSVPAPVARVKVPGVFEVGDRVRFVGEPCGGVIMHVVRSTRRQTPMYHTLRDDGREGSGVGDTWVACDYELAHEDP